MPRNIDELRIVHDLSDDTYYVVDGDGLPISGDFYITLADARAVFDEMTADDAAARRQEAE